MTDRAGDGAPESLTAQQRALSAIIAVDPDSEARERLESELRRRYDDDYDIVVCHDPDDAIGTLTRLRTVGVQAALVLVAASASDNGGMDVLARAAALHPGSKRALLVEFGAWGDGAIAAQIRQAIAVGHADYYVLKPARRGDELFHRTVSEFLHEFSRNNPSAEPREFVLIADRWSQRGHEIRRLLDRNGIPRTRYEPGSTDGRLLLERHGLTGVTEPVVVTLRGDVLVNPTNAELARNYGVTTALGATRDFDLVVVGAGPGGLAAATSAAAEGLSVLVVEREGIGGQASSSARIRNYLGFSRGVSGAELAQRAYQQAWAFGVDFLHMHEVTGLRREGDRYAISILDEPDVMGKAVLLAMGVAYRRIERPALEALVGRGVYYGASISEAGSVIGEDVFVIGGGNSAGQAALHLARSANHVTLIARQPSLTTSMSRYLIDEIDGVVNISVELDWTLVDGGGVEHLEWLGLRRGDGTTRRVAADAVFLFIGGVPRTQWLPPMIARDEAGYVLTGNDRPSAAAAVHTTASGRGEQPLTLFETSAEGVFAVGDVRANSVKRVASAVGEGSVVVPYIIRHVSSVGAPQRSVDS